MNLLNNRGSLLVGQVVQTLIMGIAVSAVGTSLIYAQKTTSQLDNLVATEGLLFEVETLLSALRTCNSNFQNKNLNTNMTAINLQINGPKPIRYGNGFKRKDLHITQLSYSTEPVAVQSKYLRGEVLVELSRGDSVIAQRRFPMLFAHNGVQITQCWSAQLRASLKHLGRCPALHQVSGISADGTLDCELAPQGPPGPRGSAGSQSVCGAGGAPGTICTSGGYL